jgi:hypothetical protein
MRLGWRQAIYQAHAKDPRALCEYLRCFALPLDEDHRRDLAELIDRYVQQRRGRKGRRPGRIPSPTSDLQQELFARIRYRLRLMRDANRGRVPHGGLRRSVEQVNEELFEDGFGCVDIEWAVETLRRKPQLGRSRRRPHRPR